MQFLLSVQHRITSDGDYQLSIPEGTNPDDLFTAVAALNADLEAEGAWVFAGGLMPPSQGAVVDSTGPEVVTIDGPHADSAEFLGGFWVIEAADRETALDWARRASAATRQEVHLRPFQG
ncbi:MAG: YciI family protein [Propionibacteriaceae bacterium]|nr:YciI family protein [Propionibacteriaceae bacterium]